MMITSFSSAFNNTVGADKTGKGKVSIFPSLNKSYKETCTSLHTDMLTKVALEVFTKSKLGLLP